MPVVMVFGLVGNLLSILVLRSSGIDMKVCLNKSSKLFVFFATVSFEHGLLSSVMKQE